jgi:hypothetical protein
VPAPQRRPAAVGIQNQRKRTAKAKAQPCVLLVQRKRSRKTRDDIGTQQTQWLLGQSPNLWKPWRPKGWKPETWDKHHPIGRPEQGTKRRYRRIGPLQSKSSKVKIFGPQKTISHREEQDYNLLDKEILKLESIEAELKEENASLEATLRKNNQDPNVEMQKKMEGYKKRLETIFDKMMYMDDFDYSPYEIKIDETPKIDPEAAGMLDPKDLVYNLREMEDLGIFFFGKKQTFL